MAVEDEIIRQLSALVRAKTGDPSARISGLTALPGHAGQSYGFELEIGQGQHRTTALEFLRKFGTCLHALELNGLRPWSETAGPRCAKTGIVMPLGEW